MSATMRAAVIRAWGGPEVLEITTVERPRPGPAEVLVRVEACAINYLDVLVRSGLPGAGRSLPHVLGGDVAGVVEESGGDAGERLTGARVVLDPFVGTGCLGESAWGGLAEYVVAPVSSALALNGGGDGWAVRHAAVPMAYGTAHRMLFARGGLQRGETLLVHGASGSVGTACVQLGLLTGATVIACSGSPEKRSRLDALGAHHVVSPEPEDLREEVRSIAPGGVDVIVDYLGRDTWRSSLRCAARGGRIVTCGATTGHDAVTDVRYLFTRELSILGSNGWLRDDLDALLRMVRAGHLVPAVHAVYPLASARDAFAEIEERRAVGKVVVTPV